MAYMKGGGCDVLGKGTMLTLANVTFECTNSENNDVVFKDTDYHLFQLSNENPPLLKTQTPQMSAYLKRDHSSLSSTSPCLFYFSTQSLM